MHQDDAIVQALKLGLSPDERKRYESFFDQQDGITDLYSFLKTLSDDGNQHIQHFVKKIDAIQPPYNWALLSFLGVLLSGSIALLWNLNPEFLESIYNWLNINFPLIIQSLEVTFSVIQNVAITNLIFSAMILAYDFYFTFFTSGIIIPQQRMIALLFKTLATKTLATAFTMAANLTLIFAVGIMNPISAGLFFVSSWMDVLHALYWRTKKPEYQTQKSQKWQDRARFLKMKMLI